MAKKYAALPTTSYDPTSAGFKLATQEELSFRLENLSRWGKSGEKRSLFSAWCRTWPRESEVFWEESKHRILPREPWVWATFVAGYSWRHATAALGVTRKVWFASTEHWRANGFGEALRTRHHSLLSQRSIGNTKGAGLRVAIPADTLQQLADSGLSVWQMHQHTGYGERVIANNFKAAGLKLPVAKAVMRSVGDMTYEDVKMLEDIFPGLVRTLDEVNEKPRRALRKLYRCWLQVSSISLKLRRVMKSYGRRYADYKPAYYCARKCEAENAVAAVLLARKVDHARQVKITDPTTMEYRIADFVVAGALVVEIDGSVHRAASQMKPKDEAQSDFYRRMGLRVLRVSDHRAKTGPEHVVRKALDIISQE